MDLLTAKISQGFDYLDADGDGKLDENDHVLMGRRAAVAADHEPGTPAEQLLVDVYLRVWREVHLPQVPEGEDAISREQFIVSTSALADDPETARAVFAPLAATFLEIADLNADGRISPEEFHAFQRSHFPDLTRQEADVAFSHLDRNGDGHLSPEEFTEAIIEYWTSRDPDAPGNWWAGRRPDA